LQQSCILKRFCFFLLPLFFLSHLGGFSQGNCTLVLKGKVVDETNRPLPGATVFAKDTNLGRVCDVNGEFVYQNLCPGEYNMEIKFLGYETKQLTIRIQNSETVEIKLILGEKILSEVLVTDHSDPVGKASNVQSISGKSLDEQRGKSLGETLQQLSGVNSLQSGPAIFKPVIHGVHSQRILILNNGIRQEGQQWGAEHAPEIDPFIASNIVVVKDAGAIKYGTDALGGVVIVTPAELPTDEKIGGQFHAIASSNGRSGTVSGLMEGGFKKWKGWGWRVQGTGKRSGDMHAPDYSLTNTGFREMNYSLSSGYHKQSKGFEFFYSHFQTTLGILRASVVSSIQDLANALEREPPQYTQPFDYAINEPRQQVSHNLFKFTGHVRKDKNLLNLQYGFQINNRKEFDVRRGALKNIPALGYLLYSQTLDLEWERTISEKHQRSVGINGMWQDNNKIDGTQTLPFIPDFTNLSAGVYWIEKISGQQWDAEAGARYDFRDYSVAGFDFSNQLYRSRFNFHNLSGTVAVTHKFRFPATITTSLGSTWRPPNVAELYSLGTHQSAAAIEFGLLLDELTNKVKQLNEINFNTEQALKWVNTFRIKRPLWNAEVTGYINYIFNYIYLRPRGITQNTRGIFPYFRYTQTDASFVGADITASYSVAPALVLNTKASLLRAKDETKNDYLIFIPSSRYEISLRHEKPVAGSLKNFFAEARIKYVSKQNRAPQVIHIQDIIAAKGQGIDLFNDQRNFDFAEAPDGFVLGSFSSGLSIPMKEAKLEVRLSIENLTNTAYREYVNRMRYYADDIGRNFILTLRYAF
jgi:iron complex outermembrane recepter protein